MLTINLNYHSNYVNLTNMNQLYGTLTFACQSVIQFNILSFESLRMQC